uniref:DDE_3 domain-containing protein n=1 Tax=Heterorhabditis bacteriophora TaxID=37862 RepID=A0A1I7X5A9_HETBA
MCCSKRRNKWESVGEGSGECGGCDSTSYPDSLSACTVICATRPCVILEEDESMSVDQCNLNPIEKVWHQLKHYLRSEYKPTTKEELMDGIRHFWKTFMTVDQCRRYVGHIQKVMKIVQSVNGDHSGE